MRDHGLGRIYAARQLRPPCLVSNPSARPAIAARGTQPGLPVSVLLRKWVAVLAVGFSSIVMGAVPHRIESVGTLCAELKVA